MAPLLLLLTPVTYDLHPIGSSLRWSIVRTPRDSQTKTPPPAWLEIDPEFAEAMRDLRAGDEVILLTWLDRGRRDVLVVRPRGNPNNPEIGVFRALHSKSR